MNGKLGVGGKGRIKGNFLCE